MEIAGNNADVLIVETNWTDLRNAGSTVSIEYQPREGSSEIEAEENWSFGLK